jgi:hypothetical protein
VALFRFRGIPRGRGKEDIVARYFATRRMVRNARNAKVYPCHTAYSAVYWIWFAVDVDGLTWMAGTGKEDVVCLFGSRP